MGFREQRHPVVEILGPHAKVVLVAPSELGQGAGHGKRQGLDVTDLFPQRRIRRLVALLIGVDLVALGGAVVQSSLGTYFPRQHDA